MERRYLVAALAIIATFAVTSRGFRTLERLSLDGYDRSEAVSVAHCWASSAAQKVAQVRSHLRQRYSPEQVQMLAEMNVPLAAMRSSLDEQMARQQAAASLCARQRALQAAERAQREALQQAERARREASRMQESFVHISATPYAAPTSSFAVSLPADFEQIQERTAEQLARSQMKLQAAAEKMAEIQVPTVNVDTVVTPVTVPDVHCKVKISRRALRDSVYSFQYGFTSK